MKQKAIIVDIDGTLTRDPLLIDDKSREGRDIFYQKIDNYFVVELELIKPVVELIKLVYFMAGHIKIIFLTAREDRYDIRENTLDFLKKYVIGRINDEQLLMRPYDDLRPNYEVKEQILKEQILPNYDVLFALDDEDNNVETFRKNGIIVLQVKDVIDESKNN